ncbi:MAG: GNAT family N-acetyltransferase, partial [Thermoplasmatota archaeon]
VDLLKQVPEGEYRFHSVGPEGFRASEEVVKDIDDHPTWMFKRPQDAFREPEHETVELLEEDSEVIDQFWNLSGGDSTDYIEDRISNGPAYGIRRDGDLVAWCLTHHVTESAMTLGFLHVKEDWRGRGFAKSVTESMCQYALENGLIPVIDIFKDNEPSLDLAKSLGFQKIGENHWFGGEITTE